MGATFLAEALKKNRKVTKVNVTGKLLLEMKSRGKEYSIYMPSNQEYEVTADVVERAKKAGANLIICDNWIRITYEGKEYGKQNGMGVYMVGQFLKMIDDGKEL